MTSTGIGPYSRLRSHCSIRHCRIPPAYVLKTLIENSLIFEGIMLPFCSLIIMLFQYLYLYATKFWLPNVHDTFMVRMIFLLRNLSIFEFYKRSIFLKII